ncbi:MAG: hypothetical protein HZB14_08405 [Actinobacteria bacterium]|nr:hypothetical protein [Actinomycetota bacterium]
MDVTGGLNSPPDLDGSRGDREAVDVERLERANRELWRENERLARAIAQQGIEPAGRSGSGAASFLRRMHVAEAELAETKQLLAEAERQRDRLRETIESVESSPSWRVTKPLRALKRAFARG